MREIIDVFRMNEISEKARVKIILQLGELINKQYAANITQPIVYELVILLDPFNKEVKSKEFQQFV